MNYCIFWTLCLILNYKPSRKFPWFWIFDIYTMTPCRLHLITRTKNALKYSTLNHYLLHFRSKRKNKRCQSSPFISWCFVPSVSWGEDLFSVQHYGFFEMWCRGKTIKAIFMFLTADIGEPYNIFTFFRTKRWFRRWRERCVDYIIWWKNSGHPSLLMNIMLFFFSPRQSVMRRSAST